MVTVSETVYTILREIAFYVELSSASSWEKSVYLKWCVKLEGAF